MFVGGAGKPFFLLFFENCLFNMIYFEHLREDMKNMDLEQYLIKQKEDAVDKVVAALVHTSDKKIKEKMSNIKEMLNLIAYEDEREAVLRCIALDIIANCYTCDDEEDFNLEESIHEELHNYEMQFRPCCSAYTFQMDYFDKKKNRKYSRTIQIPGFIAVSEFCYLIIILMGVRLGCMFYLESNYDYISPLETLDTPSLIELFDFTDTCDFIARENGKESNRIKVRLLKNEYLKRGTTLDDFKLIESSGGLISDESGAFTMTDEGLFELFSTGGFYVNILIAKIFYEAPETFQNLQKNKITVEEAIEKLYSVRVEERKVSKTQFLA